jgi:hypothetical protein
MRTLSPSWSAKADHPRSVFFQVVFFPAFEKAKTRGWSAFADHDGEGG